MILIYFFITISFLLKENLVKVQNNKIKKIDGNTYKALTLFFGFFGAHNFYNKQNVIGTLKLIIAINFLIYYIFLLQQIKKKHHLEFEEFIDKINEKNNLSSLEKQNIDKHSIKYTITHSEEESKAKSYEYQLHYDLDTYIVKNHKNFRIYQICTEIISFINLLYWILDILNIFY